ncbi:patatin-like phospholipase family protein [Curvivirga sp.]|uniref:patatin-like phospholipase family protein n=1 Tax=Curvivirga sp. TaxID=2856848 RepID=UPI003B5AD937
MTAHMKYLSTVILLLILSACTTPNRDFTAAAPHNYAKAQIPDLPKIRYWGDDVAPYMHEAVDKLKMIVQTYPHTKEHIDILALSGGGEDGAYGAGFLKGWTESGDRPVFAMVTGISTGAIIAPFAFLGSEYDDRLEEFYTKTTDEKIFDFTLLKALFGGSSLSDNQPLVDIIEREITDEIVEAIAQESRKGRFLQIGTTNLDAQRPMIWDIGRIAESGHPKATQLIRDIITASAAIPGVFPPVLFEVEVDGKKFQELHVDGGVTHQIFVYPRKLNVRGLEEYMNAYPKKNFWLIRNTKIAPEYSSTEMDIASLSGRSISTLIKYQGWGDLISIEDIAHRDGFNFNLTTVPEGFSAPINGIFDPAYMSALFEVGYQQGRSGYAWQTSLTDEKSFKILEAEEKKNRLNE